MSSDLSAVYQQAADVIRTNGHYQGAFWGRRESEVGIVRAASEGPVCIAGALSIALSGYPVPALDEGPERQRYDKIATRLADLIGIDARFDEPVSRLARWNDSSERTPADVIAALENAAKAVA
ncbi:DUF6197 family protein [Streptomyces formicae]